MFGLRTPTWEIRTFLVGKDAPRELVQNVRNVIRSVSPIVLSARLREVLSCHETAQLSNIQCPILYIQAGRVTWCARLVYPKLFAKFVTKHYAEARTSLGRLTEGRLNTLSELPYLFACGGYEPKTICRREQISIIVWFLGPVGS